MLTSAANVAKQTAVGAGDGLIKSVATKINAGAELSSDLRGDILALEKYNGALNAGIDPQKAFEKHLASASKAAKNLAQNSQGLNRWRCKDYNDICDDSGSKMYGKKKVSTCI